MAEDFLSRLFAVLGIDEKEQQGLRQDLKDILLSNISLSLIKDIPEDKQQSLHELVKNSHFDTEHLVAWMKENNIVNEDFISQTEQIVNSTLEEFFFLLFKNMDIKKKEEVSALLKSYPITV